jgi:site-specific DNA recombinase
MLDLYQEGDLEEAEFEPRYSRARLRLSELESEASAVSERTAWVDGLGAALDSFEQYAKRVRDGLGSVGSATRREIIRALVKQVEIDQEDVHIVYRIGEQAARNASELRARLWAAACLHRRSGATPEATVLPKADGSP